MHLKPEGCAQFGRPQAASTPLALRFLNRVFGSLWGSSVQGKCLQIIAMANCWAGIFVTLDDSSYPSCYSNTFLKHHRPQVLNACARTYQWENTDLCGKIPFYL